MGSPLEMELFWRGAEADLFLSKPPPWKTVVKKRVAKKYRDSTLDLRIRRERTIVEAWIMHEAKMAGVSVPSIVKVDKDADSIEMTHVDGTVARDCLDTMSRSEARQLFQQLGNQVGLLHKAGLVHGDLTTSNVIVTRSHHPFIVDFGMSRRSVDPEDRGVDLHLLQRSIAATHGSANISLIKSLAKGYRESAGDALADSSWAKAREISRRGRYFAIR